jgi:hypothetical protein
MSAFVPIGSTAAIPANNAEPVMVSGAVVTLDGSGNVLEIEGETDGTGTNQVFVLRRRVLDSGVFRYVPFAPDKPIVGELTGAGIYRFWDRLILGEVAPGEKVCLYNPAGGPVLSNCNVRLVRA